VHSEQSASDGTADLVAGSYVGRYRIEKLLGSGGMGVVFRALDTQLRRRVALKLLYASHTSQVDRERLIREARSLAKLEHPNIVQVFDAGMHEDSFFFVMALVEGQTLRAWAKEESRSWRHVAQVMSGAARGLIEAHARDIIHRDFKPENVMLADGDQAIVMDFGLALTAKPTDEPPTDPARPSHLDDPPPPDLSLTRTGGRPGTPAYMAPELWVGGRASVRSDVFSYCATYWELLFGHHPFDLSSPEQLYTSLLSDKPRSLPAGARSSAPRWLRKILQRGLRMDPEQRWPSIHAVDQAVDRQIRLRSVVRIFAVTGGFIACASAGTVQYMASEKDSAYQDCLAGTQALPSTDTLRDQAPSEPSKARDHEVAVQHFEHWLALWTDTNERACTTRFNATSPAEEISPHPCLEVHAAAARRAVQAWEENLLEDAAFHGPSWLSRSLTDPRNCGGETFSVSFALPASKLDEALQVQNTLLDAAETLTFGDRAATLESLERVAPQVRSLGFAPLRLTHRRLECMAMTTSSDLVLLHEACSQTYESALELGDYELAAHTAAVISSSLSPVRDRFKEASLWLDRAETSITQAALREPSWHGMGAIEARVAITRAYRSLNDLEATASLINDSEFALLPGDTRAMLLAEIGNHAQYEGDLERAASMLARALEQGPSPRHYVTIAINLALLEQQRGELASGTRRFAELQPWLEPDRLELSESDIFLDLVATNRLTLEFQVAAKTEHAEELGQVIARLRTALGPANAWVLSQDLQLARLQQRLGLQAQSKQTLEAALENTGDFSSQDHVWLAFHTEWLAHVPWPEAQRSWAVIEPELSSLPPRLQIELLTSAARAALQNHQLPQAERLIRRALNTSQANVLVEAEAALVFTQVADAEPGRSDLVDEARTRAILARDAITEPPSDAGTRLRGWLDAHPP
jgi:serine/threonine protein kinase